MNKLFDEFERRAAMGDDSRKLSVRAVSDQLTALLVASEDSERVLTSRINASLPRDLDQLEQPVVEHKAFETQLQSYEPELGTVKQNVEDCTRRTPSVQSKLERCIGKWNNLWLFRKRVDKEACLITIQS